MCGACGEVCPVEIPIPELLNRLRWEEVRRGGNGAISGQGSGRKAPEAAVWAAWAALASRPALYRGATALAARFRALAPTRLGAWTRCRSAPRPAGRTLHRLAREEGYDE
jgi:L-lactate dehydrogenase complex protein LldF